jgi:hypothetical protein
VDIAPEPVTEAAVPVPEESSVAEFPEVVEVASP